MKKVIGIIAILLIVAGLLFVLTGCGNKENKPNDNGGNSQKQTEKQSDNKAGSDWKDINEDNCVSIVKDKTGIDLSKLGNVTLTNAYGATTKFADITGKYENGTTKISIFEELVKELLRVSNNSIWSTNVNNETSRIEKDKEYTDYESFLAWKKNGNEDLSSNLSGTLYIENYKVGYTFTNNQFNVRVAYYVIK